MPSVIATARGYYGGVIREPGDEFVLEDALWEDEKRRPSWVVLAGKASAKLVQEHAPGPASLDEMTVLQLREYAGINQISLEGVSRKDDILARIRSHEAGNQPVALGSAAGREIAGTAAPDWVDPSGQPTIHGAPALDQ